MCLFKHVFVDSLGLKRICPSWQKPPSRVLCLVAEEADVLALPLDLLSSFPSRSVFRSG